MCHELWECGLSLPPFSLSSPLQTHPQVLHLPKAQPVPASPAWDKSWGPRGFLGVPAGCPTPLASAPWQLGVEQQGTNQPAWLSPHPEGATGTPPPCHPPASPALRHTRRGGRDGTKATTRPRVALEGHSKSHRAMNSPLPAGLCHCPRRGQRSAETPTRSPGTTGVSRHRDTLQPRAQVSAGTDGTAWDTLSSTKVSPRSPQGGDTQQLAVPGWHRNLTAGFQLVLPDNN